MGLSFRLLWLKIIFTALNFIRRKATPTDYNCSETLRNSVDFSSLITPLMLYPRIIPCLLIHKKGLVKTVKFKDPKYVGDPLNAVRIFNEKEVDELMVMDIDTTVLGDAPDYQLIRNLAAECRMPLCYGGGIKTVEQTQMIFSLGVEKIAISSAAIELPELISQVAKHVGSQSVVVILDVKKKVLSNKYELYTRNASRNTGIDPLRFANDCEALGAGEIVINSIDKDGTMNGYDFNIIDKIRDVVNIPITILGGAGTLSDIGKLVAKYGIVGAAAGSMFVFKGKYRAVLINYPNRVEKEELIHKYFVENEANHPIL
ncbi:MAG TPA: AglZ/HisF2 family acetamidino modification protein [Candidatus Babeliaceae bacterium]|nr:AglZ/HisF2 family acetamidino modification protein [Candidatus Babeliaceae bacterium]